MNVMRPILMLACVLGALAVLAPGASSAPKLGAEVANARKGIDQAVSRNHLDAEAAPTYKATLTRAYSIWGKLSGQRASELEGVIRDVAAQWRTYNRPRALTLFSMLEFNADHFADHGPLASGRDTQDEEGVVYRAFTGHGLQFHPLANFAKLNSYLGANRLDEASYLGLALIARGVPRGDALYWEYNFPFGSGRAPWTSGMAQSVAAQAFARGQAKLADPAFAAAARKAFRAVPGKLVRPLPEGLFVRLYNFSDLAVLNAQLQSIVSLEDYALTLEDPAGQELAASAARNGRGAAAEVRHRRVDALCPRCERVDPRLPALRHLAAEAHRRPEQGPVLDRTTATSSPPTRTCHRFSPPALPARLRIRGRSTASVTTRRSGSRSRRFPA